MRFTFSRSRDGQLRCIFACFRAHRFRTHWVEKFRDVCGLTVAVREAFQRVVLGEIWMNFSQDMAQWRSWGLAENGLVYFGLFWIKRKRISNRLQRDVLYRFLKLCFNRFKIAVNKFQFTLRREPGGIHRKRDLLLWAFRHTVLMEKFFGSSKMNNASITTWRGATLCNTFRFPRLLVESQWTIWIFHPVNEVGLNLNLFSH